MKGLILSGGRGTRLRPITHTNAKQLVPIANKPILFYGIEAFYDAGITDIGIVVGDTHNEVKQAVGDGLKWGVAVTYIQQKEPLGLAHAVKISEDFIRDDTFVMYLGDNMIKGGIKNFVSKFTNSHPNSQILLAHVDNPGQFGVAEIDNCGKVVKLVEKPKYPKSDLALVGVYMFDKTIFNATRQIKPSPRGELEITDAIQYLINQGCRVESHVIGGWWKDTGKLSDMLEANRMALDSLERDIKGTVDTSSRVEFKVVIEEGAVVQNSIVRGPVIIGSKSRVINSFVGPFTSIGNEVQIIDSEIEHSIVLERSVIKNIEGRISSSLIGRDVEVIRGDKKPRVFSFMLGDSSKVGVF